MFLSLSIMSAKLEPIELRSSIRRQRLRELQVWKGTMLGETVARDTSTGALAGPTPRAP